MNNDLYLKLGDILFERNSSIISKYIRIFTQDKQEKKSEVSHVGLISHSGYIDGYPKAKIIEALTTVKEHEVLESYSQSDAHIAVYRPLNLTHEETSIIITTARTYIGRTYGYFKVLLHLLAYITKRKKFFSSLMLLDKYPICSYLVAKVYAAAGKSFDVPAGFATPDDIWDFVTTHSDKYERIRTLSLL